MANKILEANVHKNILFRDWRLLKQQNNGAIFSLISIFNSGNVILIWDILMLLNDVIFKLKFCIRFEYLIFFLNIWFSFRQSIIVWQCHSCTKASVRKKVWVLLKKKLLFLMLKIEKCINSAIYFYYIAMFHNA